jgi:hypothetical protein
VRTLEKARIGLRRPLERGTVPRGRGLPRKSHEPSLSRPVGGINDTERERKKLIIPCKVCDREFELKIPIEFYEAAVAAAEGDPVEFAGTCSDWRKDDPLLSLLDKYGIPTLGGDNARRLG